MMSHTQTLSPTAKRGSKRIIASIVLAGALAMTGCQSMSRVEQNTLAGGVIGGGLGALTAAAFGASAGWVVVAGAAGAAAGAIYARNTTTNECAVSNGDGTYRIVRC
ncbi:MAG: bacteriocin [Hyphomicrobiales bacterium]